MSELAYRLLLQKRALARPDLSPRSRQFHLDAASKIAAEIIAGPPRLHFRDETPLHTGAVRLNCARYQDHAIAEAYAFGVGHLDATDLLPLGGLKNYIGEATHSVYEMSFRVRAGAEA